MDHVQVKGNVTAELLFLHAQGLAALRLDMKLKVQPVSPRARARAQTCARRCLGTGRSGRWCPEKRQSTRTSWSSTDPPLRCDLLLHLSLPACSLPAPALIHRSRYRACFNSECLLACEQKGGFGEQKAAVRHGSPSVGGGKAQEVGEGDNGGGRAAGVHHVDAVQPVGGEGVEHLGQRRARGDGEHRGKGGVLRGRKLRSGQQEGVKVIGGPAADVGGCEAGRGGGEG